MGTGVLKSGHQVFTPGDLLTPASSRPSAGASSKVAAMGDDRRCNSCGVRTCENQGEGTPADRKHFFSASLSPHNSATSKRQAGEAQALRHRRDSDGRIGGNPDHAVNLADLAVVTFGGGGGIGGVLMDVAIRQEIRESESRAPPSPSAITTARPISLALRAASAASRPPEMISSVFPDSHGFGGYLSLTAS